MHSKSSCKPLLFKLAAFFISVVMSLAVIEIAVRLIPEKKPPRMDLPLFRTALMPYNSLGYQDFEYPLQKGRNVFRIIATGDSFTEGGYVSFEDSYPKKLEYYLNSCGNSKGITYQVINMSRGGRSTPQEVRVIEHHADKLKPDLAIMGYCLNDPEDWEEGADYLHKLRVKCYYQFSGKPEGWASFFYNHSALVRLVTQRLFNTKVKRGHIKYFHKLYRDTYPGWQKARAALFDLAEFSRTSHIPVRVVIFPLFPYGWGDNYPFSDIHEKLHSVLEKAGLPYVDLLPHLKDLDHISLEYVPNKDPHPSELADRIAAEALWQELMRSGVTPEGKRSDTKIVFPKAPPKR
jgi:hypothetical protein